jgi:hypothetical protein
MASRSFSSDLNNSPACGKEVLNSAPQISNVAEAVIDGQDPTTSSDSQPPSKELKSSVGSYRTLVTTSEVETQFGGEDISVIKRIVQEIVDLSGVQQDIVSGLFSGGAKNIPAPPNWQTPEVLDPRKDQLILECQYSTNLEQGIE